MAAAVAGRSAVVSAMASVGAGPYTSLVGKLSPTLQGHTDSVRALAELPDGRLAGSVSNSVRLRS